MPSQGIGWLASFLFKVITPQILTACLLKASVKLFTQDGLAIAIDKTMPFIYTRIVRFRDTDAAGVVYFANVLSMCHEAYEESLMASGINLKTFFSDSAIAIPIVHADVDFFRPMHCGEKKAIHLTPQQLSHEEFAIEYEIFPAEVTEPLEVGARNPAVARVLTRHVCIDSTSRTRKQMPADVSRWLLQWSVTGAMA